MYLSAFLMRVKQKKLASKFNFFMSSFSKGTLYIFFIVELFVNVNAHTLYIKKDLDSSKQLRKNIGYVLLPQAKPTPNLSDQFEDAYFMYSRPLEKSTGFGSSLGELLGISIGGRNKPKFMGIGHRGDTIKWESIAIENLYRETVLPQRKDLKFNNPDIESEYCSSIFFDECY